MEKNMSDKIDRIIAKHDKRADWAKSETREIDPRLLQLVDKPDDGFIKQIEECGGDPCMCGYDPEEINKLKSENMAKDKEITELTKRLPWASKIEPLRGIRISFLGV